MLTVCIFVVFREFIAKVYGDYLVGAVRLFNHAVSGDSAHE